MIDYFAEDDCWYDMAPSGRFPIYRSSTVAVDDVVPDNVFRRFDFSGVLFYDPWNSVIKPASATGNE